MVRKLKVNSYGNFPARLGKIIDSMPEFKDEANQADASGLKKIIVNCSKQIAETEKNQSEDIDLKNLKEQYDEAKKQYTVVVKENRAKVMYAVYLLNSRGENAADTASN